MGVVAERRKVNVARQQSGRLPRDEYEAWMAGLIVTDGTVNKRWGYTRITQKGQAAPVFERLGQRFGRRVRYETQHGNFGVGHKVHLDFCDLPIRWKFAVPQFQPLSDLERHYWRGVIDGDGSVCLADKVRLEITLNYNPNREQFLGDGWRAFLERLDVPFTFSEAQEKDSIHKLRVRRHNHAVALASYLYADSVIALPWKREVALSPRRVAQLPPGERTQCAHGHPYNEENTRVRNGKRKCRTCDRERSRRRRGDPAHDEEGFMVRGIWP